MEKCDEAIAIINDAALRCKAYANVYLHEPNPHILFGVSMLLCHFFVWGLWVLFGGFGCQYHQ